MGAEMETWNMGGFYRRDLGDGLCAIILNSNSWTAQQVNWLHHESQVHWLREEAFKNKDCDQYLVSAHVPLGWLEESAGHHRWSNLEGVEVMENTRRYREVLNAHGKTIIAELYGHINKADIRLMTGKQAPQTDPLDAPGDDDKTSKVSDAKSNDAIGDMDEDIDGDSQIISFTVAGISRRGLNDPQFQRITLDREEKKKKLTIRDIDVYSMKGAACDYTFAYSFAELFQPDFDYGIDEAAMRSFIRNKDQIKRVESHISLSSSNLSGAALKDPAFIEAVRLGKAGC